MTTPDLSIDCQWCIGVERQPGSHEPLSAREAEILTAVAHGQTNRQIAKQHGVSESTVRTQLTILFRKVGVVSRAHLVTIAVVRGYLNLRDGGS